MSALQNIRAILQPKLWFAFDLDDTLHNFRAASGTALEAVLGQVHADYGANIEAMRKSYRDILVEKTSSAFTDGKTSREYRKERFQALMDSAQVDCDNAYLDDLADAYQHVLSQSLCLKPGATELLEQLKRLNKKIAIVTEGPEDAQVWTLRQLGIYDKIDFLATTNRFGTSKIDGLLVKVMDVLGVSAENLVYIGDSWQRDIEPAIQANVYAIHYVESDGSCLDKMPIRVNSLSMICSMIADGPEAHV